MLGQEQEPRAKKQTRKIRTIGGNYPSFRIGCVTYFKNNGLEFEWIDPDEYDEDANDITIEESIYLELFYKPFLKLFEYYNGTKYKYLSLIHI